MSVPNGMLALLQPLLVATASAETPVAEARRLHEAGLAHEKAGDLTAAAEAYRAALSLAPRFAEAHDRLGFVQARRLAPYLGTQPRAAGRPSAALPVPHP